MSTTNTPLKVVLINIRRWGRTDSKFYVPLINTCVTIVDFNNRIKEDFGMRQISFTSHFENQTVMFSSINLIHNKILDL